MNMKIAMGVGLMIGLSACRPDPVDIELALGARGMNSEQAECISGGLQALTDDDWRTLASFAADLAKTDEELKALTLNDIQAKLFQLNDQRLMTTLLRTGMGCTIMHAGQGQGTLGIPAPAPDVAAEPYPDESYPDESDDGWLDEPPA